MAIGRPFGGSAIRKRPPREPARGQGTSVVCTVDDEQIVPWSDFTRQTNAGFFTVCGRSVSRTSQLSARDMSTTTSGAIRLSNCTAPHRQRPENSVAMSLISSSTGSMNDVLRAITSSDLSNTSESRQRSDFHMASHSLRAAIDPSSVARTREVTFHNGIVV